MTRTVTGNDFSVRLDKTLVFTDNDGTHDDSNNNFYRLVFATSIKNLQFSKFLTEN